MKVQSGLVENRALKDRYMRFWPSPTLRTESVAEDLLVHAASTDVVLNVGSGRDPKWAKYASCRVINLDIQTFPTANVIADAQCLPFADASVDTIVSYAVLEHTRKPWVIARELYRVLRPGGKIYIGVPFLQPFHASPSDYYRFTLVGLRALLGDFEEIESGVSAGPASALVFIGMYLAGVCSHNLLLSNLAKFAVGWIISPLKHIDRVISKAANAHTVAAAVYFLGSKPLGQTAKPD